MKDYDDIIHLPRHHSQRRSHMSLQDRAAQFSPFAALTGFESAIEETGRHTDCRPELMEYQTSQLDWMMALLMDGIPRQPMISVTHFVSDPQKNGGHCETISGRIQKIDLYKQTLTLSDIGEISLMNILHMESEDLQAMPDL